MASVYRAEVSWDGTAQTNSEPSFFFSAADDNRTWAIEGRRNVGSGFAEFYFYVGAAPDPGLGSFVAGTFSQIGASFAPYDSGGTVAIEKDQAADQLRFVTPLGTEIKTLTSFGALDATRLRPVAIALQMSRTLPLTADSDARVKFYNFFGKKDGTSFLGASLASDDPGGFGPLNSATFFLPANPLVPTDNAQEATRRRLRFVYTNATDSPRSRGNREWFNWIGGDNLGANPFRILLDAILDPVSEFLYTVRVENSDRETVLFGRSEDGGATFPEVAITSTPGADFAYPSIAVAPDGRILAIWVDVTDHTLLFWAVSENFGHTWSAVTTGAWYPPGSMADCPRHRFHPDDGVGYQFFRDLATAELKVALFGSFNLIGFTPASPGVRTAGPMYGSHYGSIDFAALGQVAWRYLEGPNRRAYSSDDWGINWTGVNQGVGSNQLQPATLYDPASGFHYDLYQIDTGDLVVYPSESFTASPLTDWPTVTVIAGLAQQYPGLICGPNGKLYAIYQVLSGPVYVLACKVSDDHGLTWSVP